MGFAVVQDRAAPRATERVACCPAMDLVALLHGAASVSVFRLNWQRVFTWKASGSRRLVCMAWSPDGRRLAVADDSARVSVLDAGSGVLLREVLMPGVGGAPEQLVWSASAQQQKQQGQAPGSARDYMRFLREQDVLAAFDVGERGRTSSAAGAGAAGDAGGGDDAGAEQADDADDGDDDDDTALLVALSSADGVAPDDDDTDVGAPTTSLPTLLFVLRGGRVYVVFDAATLVGVWDVPALLGHTGDAAVLDMSCSPSFEHVGAVLALRAPAISPSPEQREHVAVCLACPFLSGRSREIAAVAELLEHSRDDLLRLTRGVTRSVDSLREGARAWRSRAESVSQTFDEELLSVLAVGQASAVVLGAFRKGESFCDTSVVTLGRTVLSSIARCSRSLQRTVCVPVQKLVVRMQCLGALLRSGDAFDEFGVAVSDASALEGACVELLHLAVGCMRDVALHEGRVKALFRWLLWKARLYGGSDQRDELAFGAFSLDADEEAVAALLGGASGEHGAVRDAEPTFGGVADVPGVRELPALLERFRSGFDGLVKTLSNACSESVSLVWRGAIRDEALASTQALSACASHVDDTFSFVCSWVAGAGVRLVAVQCTPGGAAERGVAAVRTCGVTVQPAENAGDVACGVRVCTYREQRAICCVPTAGGQLRVCLLPPLRQPSDSGAADDDESSSWPMADAQWVDVSRGAERTLEHACAAAAWPALSCAGLHVHDGARGALSVSASPGRGLLAVVVAGKRILVHDVEDASDDNDDDGDDDAAEGEDDAD